MSDEMPKEFIENLKTSGLFQHYQPASQERRLQTIALLKQELDTLRAQLRDRTYLIACMVQKFGGEVVITYDDVCNIPPDKVLHEHRDEESRTVTLRITDPQEN